MRPEMFTWYVRNIKHRFIAPKSSVPQNYWKSPEDFPNSPKGHMLMPEHSKFMHDNIKDLVNKKSKILEVGCNCGKNLNFLYKEGFTELSGIDINKNAIKLMKESFKPLYYNSNIKVDTLEKSLPIISDNSYDLVFSLTVLMHVHSDSDFIFKEMVRITKKYIVILEEEKCHPCWSHYPRNYKEIFENLGMKQIKKVDCSEMLPLHEFRIFEKVGDDLK